MKLCPSLLAADFSCLSAAIDPLQEIGLTHLHIDMMDGHFVPNLAIGLPVTASLRKRYPDMELDAHLELENPEVLIDQLLDIGVDYVGVQAEVNPDLDFLRKRIGGRATKLGLTVAPETPAEEIAGRLGSVDYVIVLSVPPGFGGQSFREDVLPKVGKLRSLFSGPIQIDGGLTRENVSRAREAGADWFVVGSGIFHADDPPAAAGEILERIAHTRDDDEAHGGS